MEKKKRGNYVDAVEAVARGAQPGKVTHIDVYHDDWCAVFSGGACNCTPIVKPRTPSKANTDAS